MLESALAAMGGDKLLDQIFNLKFTSKQLVKSSNKCEREEKAEKLKVHPMWEEQLRMPSLKVGVSCVAREDILMLSPLY